MSKPHMVNEITLFQATIRENEKTIEHLEKMIKDNYDFYSFIRAAELEINKSLPLKE